MFLTLVVLIVEKNSDRHTFLGLHHNTLEIGHYRIEQSEEEQTCRDRCNGCQRIPSVSENIGKALFDQIAQCPNLHRYSIPLPHRWK